MNKIPVVPFQHVAQIRFPAVTFCNPANIDTGEYTRAIFNNLEYDEVKGQQTVLNLYLLHLSSFQSIEKLFGDANAYIRKRIVQLLQTWARSETCVFFAVRRLWLTLSVPGRDIFKNQEGDMYGMNPHPLFERMLEADNQHWRQYALVNKR